MLLSLHLHCKILELQMNKHKLSTQNIEFSKEFYNTMHYNILINMPNWANFFKNKIKSTRFLDHIIKQIQSWWVLVNLTEKVIERSHLKQLSTHKVRRAYCLTTNKWSWPKCPFSYCLGDIEVILNFTQIKILSKSG